MRSLAKYFRNLLKHCIDGIRTSETSTNQRITVVVKIRILKAIAELCISLTEPQALPI